MKNDVSTEKLPRTLKVEELQPILKIGRNEAYELVKNGEIKSLRVGRQIRISWDSLMEYLATAS